MEATLPSYCAWLLDFSKCRGENGWPPQHKARQAKLQARNQRRATASQDGTRNNGNISQARSQAQSHSRAKQRTKHGTIAQIQINSLYTQKYNKENKFKYQKY